jgi:hypothetical protein
LKPGSVHPVHVVALLSCAAVQSVVDEVIGFLTTTHGFALDDGDYFASSLKSEKKITRTKNNDEMKIIRLFKYSLLVGM